MAGARHHQRSGVVGGGGTDTANRIVMAEMAPTLGVNINVVNVTGGVGGSVGMLEAYNRPHDGYTFAGLSESIVTAGVQGGWDKRVDVWDYYIIGGSPLVLSVPANSPHQSIADLVAAATARPGSDPSQRERCRLYPSSQPACVRERCGD
jgi:tripartite-type tricarboxylate transporter receptor subunit TctC